ncbi:hypothetical protein B0H13DRAFT_2302138 [Mycena leptocephala]|nr:hypothetical protein B0H13DRAFT_2302138 [Mycena leptocephala]
MRRPLIKYDERPRSKDLPVRGSLSRTRHAAVASHCLKWMTANFLLFIFPLVMSLPGIVTMGDCLGLYHPSSPLCLAYTIAYFDACMGSALRAKATLELHYDLYYSDSDDSFTPSTTPKESGPELPIKFDIFSRYGTQTASDGTKNELAEYFRLTSSPEPF